MEQLTLFQEDSLASLTVLPGSEEARKMTATSGRKCLGSSKNLDPLGLLVKTLLTSQTWSSTARYLTWKAQVTKGNRLLYRLAPSTPNIEEIGRSLLPTPTATDGTAGQIIGEKDNYTQTKNGTSRRHLKSGKNCSLSLGSHVQFFPTPITRDYRGARTPEKLKEKGRSVTNSLPTT